VNELFGHCYGSFLLEMAEGEVGLTIGETTAVPVLRQGAASVALDALLKSYEEKLEDVFPCNIPDAKTPIETVSFQAETCKAPAVKVARPKVLIPVFPGTNCEYDSAKAMTDAGAEAEIFVIRNLTADAIASSVEEFANKLKTAQMVFVPGGFSGGDEPDGSGKFITAFFRNAAVKEQITDLLDNRDGLMLGICNGFQALVKLGLVPYGRICDADCDMPTLTYNVIGRHQSKIVRTRVATNNSPWLAGTEVGQIFNVPISHGEGRFFASEELVKQLIANGQIATQYVDLDGNPSMDTAFNPNGSIYAIEGITSPDGRVLGKMGHSERFSDGTYRNVPGEYDMKLFASAVKYFK
jgi:phosphoribosylformylglycinamidine synthase